MKKTQLLQDLLVFLSVAFFATIAMDRTLLSAISHTDTLDAIARVFNFIGSGGFQLSLFLILLLIGYTRAYGKQGLIAFLSAAITVQALKHLIGASRPWLANHGSIEVFTGPTLAKGFDSFPSGHTTTSFALCYVFSRRYPRLTLPLYLTAVLVGLARLYCHAHWPVDVLAGAVVGTSAGYVLIRIQKDKDIR